MTKQHRFIVLGTGGAFTYNVIKRLVEQEYKPAAYIQSGDKPHQTQASFANIELDILKPQSALSRLLQLYKIPTHYQLQLELQKFIKQLNIDFMLVACWPTLIHNDVILSISKAALNLHPSLLPKYRGIDPIINQLKTDDINFGISLHLISDTYDSGDIVLQQSLDSINNLDKSRIEKEAAKKGADLFIQAINTHQNPGWKLIKQRT